MKVTGFVGYPSGHDWNCHWLKTTKYLDALELANAGYAA